VDNREQKVAWLSEMKERRKQGHARTLSLHTGAPANNNARYFFLGEGTLTRLPQAISSLVTLNGFLKQHWNGGYEVRCSETIGNS
jgi:hypothetical protein